ncbi:DUF2142 domain-containing protein [Gemmiger sp.]
MKNPNKKKYSPLLAALATLIVLLAGAVLIWLTEVRPNVGKGRSEIITDFLRAELIHDGETAEQVFTYDKDILTIGLEFYLPGEQPKGELDVVLYDADTGEELSRSVGTMDYIVPDQYSTLGMDPAVTGQEGRRYRLTVTPHYTTDAILAVGHSDGVALWKEQMSVGGRVVDGTMAMQITYQRIGGYLTRFFLVIAGFAAVLAAFAVWAVLSKKVAMHRLVFVLVLGFGLLYSFVLPPYSAPDEKYHINQSFTLACRWANDLSHDEWRMGKVPTTTTFRRVGDENADLQNENTTVFTWEVFTSELTATTDEPFDSHQEYNELQTDQNPLLYVASAAAVFLAYLLHLGFAPALALGRLANLLLFAVLAALAVKAAPFGKRVFTVAALLPMTLHLAASFSRDAPLLGLCFAFTALLLDAAFGPEKKKALSPARLAALLLCGVLLAPGKLVYLPLAALLLLVPAARLGRHAKAKKCGYLAVCLLLALVLNSGLLTDTLHVGAAQTTAAEATVTADETDRAAKGTPEPPDEVYEEQIGANTAGSFVKRLYYYVEDNAAPAQSEVDFWVQALKEGDVSPAVLGQSFVFAPGRADSYTDARGFFREMARIFMGNESGSGDGIGAMRAFDEGGAMQAYKAVFGQDSVAALFGELGMEVGAMDDRMPLDRTVLAQEVEAARATRATQSTVDDDDRETYSPGYILRHPAATVLLFVRSVVQNGDHYLRTLVGGSLSYYTVDLAWGWVVVLYLLLAYAALPVQGAKPQPAGRTRVWCCAAAALCALLAVAGCLLWTPIRYETLYGLQGRYFLPILPLLLLTCLPRRAAAVPDEAAAQDNLTIALALVQAGVIVNVMLAIIAR